MRRCFSTPKPLRIALLVLGAFYPVLVYLGLGYISPAVLVAILLSLMGLRFALDRRGETIAPAWWLAAGGILLLMLMLASPITALKSYPVLMSLGFATAFGYSLLRPPTVVESIARLRNPNTPPTAIPYLRSVTLMWFGFFIANATIAMATAASGNLALWTVYNGLISYFIMGALFTGELMVRWYWRPGGTEA